MQERLNKRDYLIERLSESMSVITYNTAIRVSNPCPNRHPKGAT